MKLLFKLTLILIVIALIALSGIFYITWKSNADTLMANSEEMLKELAYQTMTKIDHRIFFERLIDLKAIVTDSIITSRNSTPQQITERLIEYRNISKTYVSLSFFDKNQIRIADTSGLGIGKKNYSYQYINDVLQGRLSVGPDIELSMNLKLPIIFFASPVKDNNNQTFGIVVTHVPVHKLYEIMKEISLSPQITKDIKIDLTSRDGLLIYSNYNHKGILKENLSGCKAIKRVFAGEQSGVIEAHKHQGEEETIGVFLVDKGYLDFKGNGWILVLHYPTRMIYDPVHRLAYKWFLLILPGIMLAIILSIFFTCRLSKPLLSLKDTVTALGEGNLDIRAHVKSNDEIGILGNAFNLMADNLKKTTTSIKNLEFEISQRKKLEEALKKAHDNLEYKVRERTAHLQLAEERLRLATEGANLGIWHYDLITNDLFFTDKSKAIFDIPLNETVSYERFLKALHPDDRKKTDKAVQDAINNNREYDIEYRSVWTDNSIHWIAAKGRAYYDSTGKAERMEGVVIDITNLKKTEEDLLNKCAELSAQEAELRKAQNTMVRSEKLAAIGQLASSVAHELRNPLGVIKNVIYYLNMMGIGKDNEEIRDNLDIISSEIEHSNKIISDLLGFAKTKQPIAINQNINLIITEMVGKMIKIPNVKIITQLDENLPEIPVDQLQMQQIFNNLSSNAIHSMENGGTLTIKTMMEDNFIKIIFTDTGIGIPKENIDKIFEPLFSTKAYGTGFGLSIVKLLVEKHNGKIEVESEAGKGSTFTVALPTKISS